jgi:acyl-[acyl carrier protein]--UDP-N-acetylglucosamine O-acyltransferase
MALIHSSAIIDPKAEIAEDVEIGPYACIPIGSKPQKHC